jgi:hypothetical protein
MANAVEKDVENAVKADAQGVVAHLERMWAKHFGNVSPGTELHAALDLALRDIRAGVHDLFGAKKAAATANPPVAASAAGASVTTSTTASTSTAAQ